MKQRDMLTEAEHVKLVKLSNEFYEEFGKIVAKVVNNMPPDLETLTLYHLQGNCSVFGSGYDKHLTSNTGTPS